MANLPTIRSVETYGRLASKYARAAAAHLRELHFDELIAEYVDSNGKCLTDLRRCVRKATACAEVAGSDFIELSEGAIAFVRRLFTA
ncbi:hypothetical protein V5F59_04470 [Xanthobacter autotrophicus DSM 431]|uniref:hypothetical protein n=1 Tax=Xanthobacter nonsaccharivorans TaxID=3119912 RepID=UPI0037263B99